MPALNRPVVKRQYGSRKASSSTSSNPTSSSTLASSSSPLRSGLLSTPDSEWEEAIRENAMDTALDKGKGKETANSTPTVPSSPSLPSSDRRTLRSRRIPSSSLERISRDADKANKGDLRSFFTRTSPPRSKRRKLSPQRGVTNDEVAEDDDSTCSSAMSRQSSSNSTSTTASTVSSSSGSSRKPVKLAQLFLDPFDTPGRSTLSCPTCALSYARTPEDINFHARHHKKVVSGVDWSASHVGDRSAGVTVLQEEIEWDGKERGKILMIDWSLAENGVKRRLTEVMETIDTELSSTSLTEAQLAQSKVFVFVTPNRKVVACAVVARIEEAYRVVTKREGASTTGRAEDEKLIEFGRDEEDSGAIFCSPEPSPTLLGVHRIWTSTSSRRHGLASRLLDHVARRFLYACPISTERRKEDVAFSQPTGKGKELATRWTGTERFKVFVD